MTNGSSLDETIGLDISDKTGVFVVLNREGEQTGTGKVAMTELGIREAFGRRAPCLVAIEVGTHSPWASRLLADLGYEVLVANPRQVKLIKNGHKKTDLVDAENLARAARFDRRLLRPIQHRGIEAQTDRARLSARRALVDARTRLIVSARGLVKAVGGRLPRCSAESFPSKAHPYLPELLRPALEPMLESIENLSCQIKALSQELERLAQERYPETRLLQQVPGVGPICSLAYVLTLEDPGRFRRSRQVGAYLGLTPRQHDSGELRPQLHITKAGDDYLRSLLVQSAHYILGRYGPDSDLRRWGLRLAGEGSQARKNKAIVAVARKLSVLLHRLWLSAEPYEALRQAARLATAA
jgi:transposase